MQNILIGDKLQIQCYKHDGKIHRAWSEAVVIDVKEEYIVCGNYKTLVIESQGHAWKTKEPAVMYFFKDKWYNVITQFKSDGIYFYCNIASPYIIEENTIKYIDYDLDLRVFPDGQHKVLDIAEYEAHKKEMEYGKDLDGILNDSLKKLIKRFENGDIVFNKESNINLKKVYEDKTK
jgi:protein associated with RNAse G/E